MIYCGCGSIAVCVCCVGSVLCANLGCSEWWWQIGAGNGVRLTRLDGKTIGAEQTRNGYHGAEYHHSRVINSASGISKHEVVPQSGR